MSHVRSMTKVASAYDQWARTYETIENVTRDLAATVLRQYLLPMHDRDVPKLAVARASTPRTWRNRVGASWPSMARLECWHRPALGSQRPRCCWCSVDSQHARPLAEASVDLVVCLYSFSNTSLTCTCFFRRPGVCYGPAASASSGELHPFRQLRPASTVHRGEVGAGRPDPCLPA